MLKRLIACSLCLLLFGIPSLHAAQVLFTPALVLSEEYTDNLFLDDQDEVYDFNSAAGLDLKGELLWRTAGIELSYAPTYNSYQENNQLSYWRHEAGLYSWKQFLRNTKLELRDTYLRTSNPRDQSATIEQEGQPPGSAITPDRNRRGRKEYYTNVAEARINQQFGADSLGYVAYRYSTLRDVDTIPGQPAEDNEIHTPFLGLNYAILQSWVLELDSAYGIADYKDRNDRSEYDGNLRSLYRFNRSVSGFLGYRHTSVDYDQDTDEDFTIHQPGIGIRYEFQDNGRVEIGAGYYIQDFETSETQEGFIASSTLNKRWNYRTAYFGISGGSGYAIDDKGVEDNGLNIYYDGKIETGYSFAPTLTGSVYGGYRYDEYPNDTPERVQNTSSAGLAFDWQALRWMMVRLAYDFTDLRSDIATEEYTENRALLTVRIAPANPYRLSD